MNLTEKLLPVALLGAEWVLWMLILLSVISVAVMIERAWYFRATGFDFDQLRKDLDGLLSNEDVPGAQKRVAALTGIEGDVISAGLAAMDRGATAADKAMGSAKSAAKLKLERNLAFLGTLGNNAPFVGLFGTVIGVIKAFHDLASKKGQGPEAVMGSLSEALIATAVGLLVAIPAVAAFNYFQRRVRTRMASTDSLAQLVLSHAHDERGLPAPAGAGSQ
jgi:biopolymer transport protein ExbB